jgi:hypothetical protein
LNPELPPSDHRNIGRSFEEALPYTVSEDLPVPLDFGEVLPYEGGTFTDTRPVEPSGAATAASNHITASSSFTQVSSAQDSGAHEEDAAAPIRVDTPTSVELPTPVKLPTVMNEPDHRQLSDIEMDRLSAISITSSEISDFSSLLSLAQRIRLGQTGETSSGRDSVNDLPSSAMDWYIRNSGLYLFGRRSIAPSIASSQKTSSSRMSWRPEIPVTHNPAAEAAEADARARHAEAALLLERRLAERERVVRDRQRQAEIEGRAEADVWNPRRRSVHILQHDLPPLVDRGAEVLRQAQEADRRRRGNDALYRMERNRYRDAPRRQRSLTAFEDDDDRWRYRSI